VVRCLVVLADMSLGKGVEMEVGDREVGRGINMMRNMKKGGDGEGGSGLMLRRLS
jgi:hypothetical protein